MRKRKYRLHYGDYAPEENERLYMDMSKKGWRLAKRGIFFSRFVRTEPEDLLYRIDFSAPDVFGDASLRWRTNRRLRRMRAASCDPAGIGSRILCAEGFRHWRAVYRSPPAGGNASHSSEKYNLLIDTMYSFPASLSAAFLLDGRRRFLLCRMGCTIAERMD